MKETFELNKMGLMPMTEIEMEEIDGGFFFLAFFAAAFVVGLIVGLAANSSAAS